eukprot:CAMPEP_0118915664 /NCGR_PEP_ID=MMETSP1166-20130328/15791_1 /TAXON_ID=1104430 /ORGANISM="Chrysoreinhardia sp, Strain CCMP3193" /LENGTH=97 /DNA_ID=CAMNT_0006855387 /DNA_START=78 /DNA_END=372 /DNA_ORIENTATION=-
MVPCSSIVALQRGAWGVGAAAAGAEEGEGEGGDERGPQVEDRPRGRLLVEGDEWSNAPDCCDCDKGCDGAWLETCCHWAPNWSGRCCPCDASLAQGP